MSLTLALYACPSAYAFAMSPSPLPCLDITQPLPACTFATVLSHGFSPLPLISQYAQARETQPRVRIGPVSVSPGPLISPPRLPYYNFVRTNLFLFVSWFVVQLGEKTIFWVVSTLEDRPLSINGSPPPKPCRPYLMSFGLLCMSFMCLDSAYSSSSVLVS